MEETHSTASIVCIIVFLSVIALSWMGAIWIMLKAPIKKQKETEKVIGNVFYLKMVGVDRKKSTTKFFAPFDKNEKDKATRFITDQYNQNHIVFHSAEVLTEEEFLLTLTK